MENEFRIKINSDSQGNKVSLDNITIEAAEALKIFIDLLTELAKSYENYSHFKISLNTGSVESCLIFPKEGNNNITNDINSILNGQSEDHEKVNIFRKIQNKVKQNGLDYGIYWRYDNSLKDITHVFKGRKFSLRQNETINEIFFLKGKLYEAGGKKTTNVHIEDLNDVYKVKCSKEEAIGLNKFLYQSIFLSTVKSSKNDCDISYKLLDFYNDLEEQIEFKNFVCTIVNNDRLEKYDILHDKIYEFISENKIDDLNKLIKVFSNDCTDRGVLRTILMSLKPIIKNESFTQLKPSYDNISDLLRIGSLNNQI